MLIENKKICKKIIYDYFIEMENLKELELYFIIPKEVLNLPTYYLPEELIDICNNLSTEEKGFIDYVNIRLVISLSHLDSNHLCSQILFENHEEGSLIEWSDITLSPEDILYLLDLFEFSNKYYIEKKDAF